MAALIGRAQCRGQRVGEPHIVAARNDGEFVVLEAAKKRRGRQQFFEPHGDGAHHFIATNAAHGVVDLAKAVRIDQREGDVAARAPALLGERALEAFDHDALVGQSGQQVFARQLAHGSDAARERAGEPQRRSRRYHDEHQECDTDNSGKTPQPVHGADQRPVRHPGEPADDAAVGVLHRLHLAAAVGHGIDAELQPGDSAALFDQPQRVVIERRGVAEDWPQFLDRLVQRDLSLGRQTPVVGLRHHKSDGRTRDRRGGQEQERQ